MSTLRVTAYTALTMIAFAANSLLCRLALKNTSIDAASFSTVRILSGAMMLWLVMRWRDSSSSKQSTWHGAAALFVYVAAFSFAYLSLSAGTGTLLLFGAVQTTMILAGFIAGERVNKLQGAGFIAALAGLVILVLPSVATPTLTGSVLMIASGIAWGLYSLFGRNVADPIAATAGNFLRAIPFTIALSLFALPWMKLDVTGLLYATLSGALTSGLGYVLWYRILRDTHIITVATAQLSVPVLAALGGVIWLSEVLSQNLLIASVLILGGVGLVLRFGKMRI